MAVIPIDYVRIDGYMPEKATYTAPSGAWNCSWSIDMSEEPHVWEHTAQELMDKYYYTNRIQKALGDTHYVKNNKLYRR